MDVTRATPAVLFIGPVFLAVAYTLIEAWVPNGERDEEAVEG